MPETQTYLAFDYGEKRIGVAVGQNITKTAQALPVLAASAGEPDWQDIKALVQQWRPNKLIVGMPYNMDDRPHVLTERVLRFSEKLAAFTQLDVQHIDERLTSIEAETRQKEIATRNKSLPGLDSIAAQIILETWLQGQ